MKERIDNGEATALARKLFEEAKANGTLKRPQAIAVANIGGRWWHVPGVPSPADYLPEAYRILGLRRASPLARRLTKRS